jgi:transposase
MEHYAGIDVSLESASLCVVDATGRIVREAKVASEPNVLIGWFRGLEFRVTRMGLEAGPLSQWLYAGMRDAGLAVELLETRHVRDAFKAMPVKMGWSVRHFGYFGERMSGANGDRPEVPTSPPPIV